MTEAVQVTQAVQHLDLTTTWVGILSFIIFVVSYYFIATEDKYHINKAKPALFGGTLIFMLIGAYYAMNGLDMNHLHHEVEILIFEIAGIFFFLFVAMTYIEAMIDRNVFSALRYNLVSKGYDYKKLFWITGFLAFFISPIADNLTTALILSTVLITIDKENKAFIVPAAVNIVVAANAGGAWSPFGDITTLMVWVDGKGQFIDFLYLFPASILGWGITALLLSRFVPNGNPPFSEDEQAVEIAPGGKIIMGLFAFTIASAVLSHQVLHLPAMWGMMFGLAVLKLYVYSMSREVRYDSDGIVCPTVNVFSFIAKIENDTLLFFFGILAAVGGLHFLGFLEYFTALYTQFGATTVNIGVGFLSAIVDNVPVMSAVLKSSPDMGVDAHAQWMLVTLTAGVGGSLISFGSAAGVGVMGKLHGIYTQFGATTVNIGVGFLSAIVDNVPVMSAVLKSSPDMGVDAHAQWMLVTLTAGVGGSLISFGSAAGVGVMGKLHGIYTFASHMKLAWTVLVGYIVSVAIWYVQFMILGFGA